MEGWLEKAKEIKSTSSTSVKRKADEENQAPSETPAPVDLVMRKTKRGKFPSPQSIPMDLTTRPAEADWGKKTQI